jgi:hypothetical protein
MPALLKNVLITALLVAGVTVASVTFAFVASMVAAAPGGEPPPPIALAFALAIAIGAALLAGMLFCVATLFMAALTMPPMIGLAHMLRLPRPLVDIIGGGAVAYLCVQLALDESASLAQYGLLNDAAEYIFTIVGVSAGCLLGLIRHAVLVRESSLSPVVA